MAKRKPTGQKQSGKQDTVAPNKPAQRNTKPLRGASVPQSQRKGGR